MTEPFDPAEPTRSPDPADPAAPRPARPRRVPAEPVFDTDDTAVAEHQGAEQYHDDHDDEFDHDEYDDEYDDEYEDEFEDDYVEIKDRKGGCGRWLVVLAVIVIAGVGAVAAGWFWYQGEVDPSGPEGPAVAFVVPPGATSDDIGVLLADNDVISSSRVWGWYLRLNGGGPFQAGEYSLPTNAAMGDVVDRLELGPKPPESEAFTIPEAFTVPEITARLADPDNGIARWSEETLNELVFTQAITTRTRPADQGSYEGMFFPDTYQVDDDETEQQVLQRLADQMDAVLDEIDADGKGAALGLNRYEVVILASLIEEEARLKSDQPKISRVIHNRLEQRIPLGIDATSRYEAVLAGRSRDALDFSSDSPYNTRRFQGLPPTPIASPGRAAIEAALNPEPGTWTFYVLADEAGNHFFTDSNQEFLRAKEQCRQKGLGCG